MSVWHVEACRHTQMRCILPNQTQCFRALLHHVHLTCGSMQTYPNEMYPPKLIPVLQSPTTPCPFDMWKHEDIPKWDVSPLIEPSASEPYYTMSVWHVEACRHTQMRCIPLIEPSASEPYYTISVWHVEACRHTQMRCILPNWSQCFIALLHHICLTCGSMQTYWNEMYTP